MIVYDTTSTTGVTVPVGGGVADGVTTESYQLGSRNRYLPHLSGLPTLTVPRSVPADAFETTP